MESEFRIVFWLILGIGVVTGVLVLVGTVFHIAVFGTVLGLIFKGIRGASGGRSAAPGCAHCGSALPEGVTACPNCGAPAG